MSSDQPAPGSTSSVAAEGFCVSIPADVIASALATGTPSSADAIRIQLGGLQLTVPAAVLQGLAQQMVPDRALTLSFADGAIRVQLDNLPALRFELPADGLRVTVEASGLRILGTGA